MQKFDSNAALRNLSALVDFSNLVNSSLDLDFALNNILLTCLGKFHTSKGLIALLDDNNVLKVKAFKGVSREVVDLFPSVNLEEISSSKKLNEFVTQNNFEVVQTIKSSQGIKGLILLGKKLIRQKYEEDDIEFLKTILNVGATAIENSLIVSKLKEVNRELDTKVNQLSSLFDLSKEFSGILQPEAIGRLLVYTLIGHMLVSNYAIVIYDRKNYSFLENSFNENLLNDSLKECNINLFDKPVIRQDLQKENEKLFDLGIELVVPMQIKNETKGLILLGKRKNNLPYSKSDIEFIYSLGNLAIISIENTRLFQEMIEKQRMERDLETARSIQKNLLPKTIPSLTNLSLAAYNISARIVGGDYYDIVKLDDDKILIAIADVSGKGVPASLLMANLQAFLKSICKQQLPLDEATNLINDLVAENTTMGSFITFFWCVFDNSNKQLTYVNAGHNPPLLLREGKIYKLKKGGMVLGFLPTSIPYISEKIELKSGDVIVLFTDGITEAMNKNFDEYSDERLEKLIIKNSQSEPQEILDKIKQSVSEFINGAEQSDDITCLVMKVK
ncbi:MAG: SpoIIE family protein phosphatase [Melioribacter sp.]|uniref:GAF domain-containing SpoIIE family protein phosphatase n=1 Tax=Rosettibacter primus TaxID=3111523 RepID=UPI00247EE940|nr:SpoIIE family protein phosphatase [Melioribacter sp.]